MPFDINIDRLRIPPGISVPPTVTMYYKPYYDEPYELVESGINIDENGYVTDSPKPMISVEPGERYLLMAVNESCGYEYVQSLILYPYCPVGFALTPDASECFYEEVTDATPPEFGENTVAQTYPSYSICGSYIYEEGYNVNGTGTSNQINNMNAFWKNGVGPTCVEAALYDGPLNRAGLWSVAELVDQTVGFAHCFDIAVGKTYYVGIAADNLGILNLDGVNIITQDPAALDAQYGLTLGVAPFQIWHIYPVFIPGGSHVLELLGYNTFGPAAMGCEIYDNTPLEIAAATDYTDLNLVFSSKDYIGMPVMLGSGGVGYSCPDETYSLRSCASPYECVRRVTTPVLVSQG